MKSRFTTSTPYRAQYRALQYSAYIALLNALQRWRWRRICRLAATRCVLWWSSCHLRCNFICCNSATRPWLRLKKTTAAAVDMDSSTATSSTAPSSAISSTAGLHLVDNEDGVLARQVIFNQKHALIELKKEKWSY